MVSIYNKLMNIKLNLTAMKNICWFTFVYKTVSFDILVWILTSKSGLHFIIWINVQ